MGPSEGEWTIRREKPLLFKRHKVVRFLISPKNKKMKIEVNNSWRQETGRIWNYKVLRF